MVGFHCAVVRLNLEVAVELEDGAEVAGELQAKLVGGGHVASSCSLGMSMARARITSTLGVGAVIVTTT
jgi:hypothetical protein